jgi:ADP-heptose:LPS heptosyltransferase
LLGFLDIPFSRQECRPYLPDVPPSTALTGWLKEKRGSNIIGVNLSAGEKVREWSLEKWRMLLGKLDQPVILFAMPGRFGDKQKLEAEFPDIIPTPVTESLYDAGHLIGRCRTLVSPDTSLIHVASCYNTPVVGLYRADENHLRRFAPYLVPNRTVVSPSYRIEDISVEHVLGALRELLENEPDQRTSRPD